MQRLKLNYVRGAPGILDDIFIYIFLEYFCVCVLIRTVNCCWFRVVQLVHAIRPEYSNGPYQDK